MGKQSLLFGTLILLGAAVINRILGFANQMIVINWIGPEGYGLLQLVYPTFLLLLVGATAGIPTAMSKVIAEDYAQGRHGEIRDLFNKMRRLVLLSGLFFVLIGWLIAPYLFPDIIADVRAYGPYLGLLPCLALASYASVYRGYYQGLLQMGPTALAQVMEQLVRVAGGLSLAYLLRDHGIVGMATGLALGISLGEAFGLLALIKAQGRRSQPQVPPIPIRWRLYLPRLLGMAIPLTISRVISTLLMALDAFLIPLALQTGGVTLEASTLLFGQLTGVIMPLIGIPMVFTVPLVTTLIPGIAEGKSLEDQGLVRYRGTEAVRGTLLIGLPAAVTLFFLATPLCQGLFSSPQVAPILQILSFGALFFYLHYTTTGLLQGLSHVIWPLITYLAGSLIRLGSLWWLTGLHGLGLQGVAYGVDFGFVVAALFNLLLLIRFQGMTIYLRRDILSPAFATAAMIAAYALIPSEPLWALLPLLIYLGSLFFTGGLKREDIRRLMRNLPLKK